MIHLHQQTHKGTQMLENLKNFRRGFIVNVDDIISYDHPNYEDYESSGVFLSITPVINFKNKEGHDMTVSMTALGYFITDDPTSMNDFEYCGSDIVPELGYDKTADIKMTRTDLEDLYCFTELDDQLWGDGDGQTGEDEMWSAVKAELMKLKDALCKSLVDFGEEPISYDIYVLSNVLKRL